MLVAVTTVMECNQRMSSSNGQYGVLSQGGVANRIPSNGGFRNGSLRLPGNDGNGH